MQTEKCKDIAAIPNRFCNEEVGKVARSLPDAPRHLNPDDMKSPSPPQLVNLPSPEPNVDVPLVSFTQTSQDNNLEKPLDRKVILSNGNYEAHQLVKVLCNIIFCGLQNLKGEKEVYNLSPGCELSMPALKLTKEGYDWVQLDHLKVSREILSRQVNPQNFYVIGMVGVGKTSRAFRAVTESGHECVIKMYVKKFEENRLLPQAEFDKNARESVKREVEHYHKIYKELESQVWHQQLNSFYCLVLPYFLPIP
jgi:hypothetical protein